MKSKFSALAAASALVCTLSACGGGGGGQTVQPVTQTASTPKIEVRMYGDSTMFGLEYVNGTPQGAGGTYIGTPNNVPADLTKLLQADLGPSVSAAGVANGGASIRDAVLGQHGFAAPLGQVLASDPDRIILENFGINDSVQYSADEFRQYLVEFITIAQQAGKIVILETPQPTCNLANDQLWPNPDAAVVVEVAAQMGLSVIDQYSYIQTIPNWCQTYMGDGTHPKDDQLYELKAQYETPVVESVVKLVM